MSVFMRTYSVAVLLLMSISLSLAVDTEPRKVAVRDIATIEGVRDNPLVGYGIVVGLNGTGDRRQTMFTIQTLANALQRMGVQIPTATARVNNVAAVFVTASLPAFARPGTHLDVTVSSIGDAKSLEGGLLLLTPLYGADGTIYAAAQGPLTIGGYSAGGTGNSKQVNHPTVGRIPAGGLVERDTAIDLQKLERIALMLSEANFRTASDIASAVNQELGKQAARAIDARRIEIIPELAGESNLANLLARVEGTQVLVHPRARVIVNERTGTIVMGREVKLGAVSILHGSLSIEIATEYAVSQPSSMSHGQTTTVAQPDIRSEEKPARRVELNEGATVEQLVSGLQNIGATARDVIAILEAIKAAGALEADLEVI